MEGFAWDDLRKIFTESSQMAKVPKWRRNTAENVNPLSRAQYRRQTDKTDRRTDDDIAKFTSMGAVTAVLVRNVVICCSTFCRSLAPNKKAYYNKGAIRPKTGVLCSVVGLLPLAMLAQWPMRYGPCKSKVLEFPRSLVKYLWSSVFLFG